MILILIFNSDTPDRYTGEVSGVGINRERARARKKKKEGKVDGKKRYLTVTFDLVCLGKGGEYRGSTRWFGQVVGTLFSFEVPNL